MRFDLATLCLAPLLLGACASLPRVLPAVPRDVAGMEQCIAARFAAALPANAAVTSVTRGTTPVAHCRVRGTITTRNPGPNTVNFSLTLPDRFNGRYAYEAPGGSAGFILEPSGFLLAQGYALATSDQGTRPAFNVDYRWRADPAQLLDYNHRGVHVASQATQALTKAYYNAQPVRYLVGCSGGGRSGRNSMRNYGTEDFDGVLAGAPPSTASNTTMHGRIAQHILRNPAAWISPEQILAAEARIIATHDAADGAVDGIVQDDRLFRFDASILRDIGLTPAQIEVVDMIRTSFPHLAPPAPVTNGGRAPGFGIGKVSEWTVWHFGTVPPPWNLNTRGAPLGFLASFSTLRAIYGENFDFATGYDFSNPQQFQTWSDVVGDAAGASGYDYAKFPAGGGKSIIYIGTGDAAVPFKDAVVTRQEMLRHTPDLDRWNKVYLLGGWGHCGPGPGGRGPANEEVITTTLQALVDWVERGREPQGLTMRRVAAASLPERTFLFCPEPMRAQYSGNGDINAASSWSCRPLPAQLDPGLVR